MENRPIFIKIKNYVEAQGYTISQIQNVTTQQVKSLLNLTNDEFEEYSLYASGIKKILINKLQEVAENQTITDFKSEINSWLIYRFPDYEVEKDFSNKNNRKVIFHLDGGVT